MAKYDLYDSQGNFIGTAKEQDDGKYWTEPHPVTSGERLFSFFFFALFAAGSFFAGIKLAERTDSIFLVLIGLWLLLLGLIFAFFALKGLFTGDVF